MVALLGDSLLGHSVFLRRGMELVDVQVVALAGVLATEAVPYVSSVIAYSCGGVWSWSTCGSLPLRGRL